MKALILAALVFPGAALAQANCAPRDILVDRLAERYGETRRAYGLGGQTVMEVFASESGSWTITATHPNGIMCLVAVGEDFQAIKATKKPNL